MVLVYVMKRVEYKINVICALKYWIILYIFEAIKQAISPTDKNIGNWYLQVYQVCQKTNLVTYTALQALTPKITEKKKIAKVWTLGLKFFLPNKKINIYSRFFFFLNKGKDAYICDITSAVSSLLGWQVTPSQASQLVGAQGSPFQPILSGIRRDSFNALIAITTKTNALITN